MTKNYCIAADRVESRPRETTLGRRWARFFNRSRRAQRLDIAAGTGGRLAVRPRRARSCVDPKKSFAN